MITSVLSTVLSYPALQGMDYPKLQAQHGIHIVADEAALLALPSAERQSVRVLMTSATRGCNATVADALPGLRLVVSQGAGQDKIDLKTLTERKILVRSVGEALTDDVADLAMALANILMRDLLRADSFARTGEWERVRFNPGQSLVGKTMGIAGLSGRIGQAIARRALVSRMEIAGLRRPSNEGLGAILHDDFEALARASDVLVLATPGGPSLRHIVGARELAALGPEGYLVNVGRGDLVDTNAMIDALESKAIAGAGLDVLEGEPKVPERLAKLPNVVLSPHIGGGTWGARARGARIAEDEILGFLASA